MKKLILTCFFAVFTVAFSRSEKIILVDYSYILDNYYKTKSYNKTLNKLRENLETKYNINFDDRHSSENKTKAIETYREVKTRFTNEINQDIDIAIVFTGQTEDYNLIIEKSVVRYSRKKGKDISKNIVKFLNEVYFHDITIKDEIPLKNDLFSS